MTTILVPGYTLGIDFEGDAESWSPTTFRVVLPGDLTTIAYDVGPTGITTVDVTPYVLEADGVNLVFRGSDGSIVEDLAFLTLQAPGYDADLLALRSPLYRDEFYVGLGGDPLPGDLGTLEDVFLAGGDDALVPISGGPASQGRPIDLGRLPGAEVTQDDRVILNGVPSDPGGLNDDLFTGSGRDVVASAAGDDRVILGAGADLAFAGRGDDVLIGGAGADRLVGGQGEDRLFGGAGSDRLDGGGGDDRLVGGRGRDDLRGDRGDDSVQGRGGSDLMRGGAGDDLLDGNRGADDIEGGNGRDVLDGASGRDRLDGGAGNDTLLGGRGSDRLVGGVGNDTLQGGRAGDVLRGGGGRDELIGGGGDDRLIGGRGDDIFVFEGGDDRIADFALRRSVDSVTILYDDLLGIPRQPFVDVRPEVIAALIDAAEMRDGALTFDFGRKGSLAYEGLDMGDLDRVLDESNLVLISTF